MPKHQTIHKELKQNYNKLKNHRHVKNIALGRYDNCRHKYKPGTIRFQSYIDNGIKAIGYDGSGTIPLYIYIEPLCDVTIAIVKGFIEKKIN